MVNIPVIELIPQRPPMVMIGELVEVSDQSATSTFTISTPNIFIEKNCFTESGMVENIAQTAAAMVGYQCRMENKLIPVGYIAALKNLTVRGLPAVGSTIRTTVTVTNNVLDVTIVRGAIEQEGRTLCACELRIFIRPEV